MENIMNMPIPRDIMLDLPSHPETLKLAIVFLFLLHILFVNLMIGGTLFTVIFEYLGIKRPDYDRLAREIGATITVNKSLAVVLGVAPLLTINVLYTIYFYTSNAITGLAWIMVVPLVSIAFLLGYLHKYTWDQLSHNKLFHISLSLGALIIFLLVPLIFLANINLMQFPERWNEVEGWLSSLFIPNVLPRYLHFLLGSVAISGLFFAGYFSREAFPARERFDELSKPRLRQMFYSIALWATLANFLAGPLLLFTLPTRGLSIFMVGSILCGAALAVFAAVLLWREIATAKKVHAFRFYVVVALLTGTVVFMGMGRQLYREGAIAVHRTRMDEESKIYEAKVNVAQWRTSQGLAVTEGADAKTPGERVFENVCASCHAYDTKRVGPPLTEIVQEYQGDKAGFIEWVKNPGKKRPEYPKMPAVSLTASQYSAVTDYVFDWVESGGAEEGSEEDENSSQASEASTESATDVSPATGSIDSSTQP